MEKTEVLVVGAGVIGLVSAWRLAQQGKQVMVIEKRYPGSGATHAAAGILAPTAAYEWEGELGALNADSMKAWPRFAEELNEIALQDFVYQTSGSLKVAAGEGDLEVLAAMKAAYNEAKIEYLMLSDWQCSEEEKGLKNVMAGILTPNDAHVHTINLVEALMMACEVYGVQVISGVEPRASKVEGGEFQGVILSNGETIMADVTVVACGAWSGALEWLPEHIQLPAVYPVAGEYALLSGALDTPVSKRIIRTSTGSFVPRNLGGYWLGTSVRDAGFIEQADSQTVEKMFSRMAHILPEIRSLRTERVGVGLRPMTRNHLPVIEVEMPGLIWATGHSRAGILQAPVTAEKVIQLAA